MVMVFYVDTREMLKAPKLGKQYIAWYNRSSINSPDGYPHVDVINGEEVQIRSMDEEILVRFLKNAYSRSPYVKAKEIMEQEVDY